MNARVLISSIVLFLVANSSCEAEELFLRSNGGFQIQVESDWGIDPLEAYKQATESLSNKLRIHGVSYKNLSTIMELNEDLAVEDRAYGKVYRMKLTGFISDEELAKAKFQVKTQSTYFRIRVLASVCVVLGSVILFAIAFVKADRLLNGDKRTTVGSFCTAWFLVAMALAVFTIW